MTEVARMEIAPALRIRGVTSVPGDKAISHRLAMIASIAEGETVIRNFSKSADCGSTLEFLRRLGVSIQHEGTTVTVQGSGLHGLRPPSSELDAGNSGTTVRFMSGLAAGFPFESTFIGDESLSRRPMKRIIDPLRRFGAAIEARDDNYLPLKVRGVSITAIDFELTIERVAVKTAV